jgi:hypothetical protein
MTDDTSRPGPGSASPRGGVFGAQDVPGGSADGENTVRIVAWPDQPVSVRQSSDQTISFRGEIPVCIRVCEPICARSDYSIGITVFDRPVATITVSGQTRIQNCGGTRPNE